MINTSRVFKELKARWEGLSLQYKPTDKILVGLRYANGELRKADAIFKQIPQLLTMLFDNKHPETEDMKHEKLLSIFIVDSTGTTFYDSNEYKPSKNKYSLRTDKDTRVLRFNSLSKEDKEQVVEITVQQIQNFTSSHQDSNEDENDKDSPWEGMPW